MNGVQQVVEELRRRGFLIRTIHAMDFPLRSVVSDSRKVSSGDLFCCVPGAHVDGHEYAAQSVARGATALLCERLPEGLPHDFPILIVKDSRRAMGVAAAVVAGQPSNRLTMVGVTGTNGKSTTTYMIRSIMNRRGQTGLMGTICYDDGDQVVEANRTTPEGPDIQSYLANMVNKGCHGCVMEASSHGLEQGRLEGCLFDVGVFTNLTSEHLDYHGDMESYFQAKNLLFESYIKPGGRAIINLDDPYGRRLASGIPSALTYSMEGREASVSARSISLSDRGVSFDLLMDEMILPMVVPIIGRYNVANVLAAVTASLALKYDRDEVLEGLRTLPQIPGRMERFAFVDGPCAVVDYAHSTDALKNLLDAVSEICRGRIISVFGLGGDRFRDNRWAMGEVAASMADHLVLTMDNPRSEEPEAIVQDILKGVKMIPNASWEIVLDRSQAIRRALDQAELGDIVVISGKGPERYILVGDTKIPYNDAQEVQRWGEDRGLSWT